jgi:mRNA-degrading endonuclease RelE of RelBE toxin-antitoxin system
MNYNVIPIAKFKKEAKRLIKKYPSLKNELQIINEVLQTNPTIGTPLGNDAYKVRIAIKSKAIGKSGEARIITYHISKNKEIYLLTIYDKAEFESIDDKTLKKFIDNIDIK